jgi:predicted nucleic acid-binding protein
VIHLDTSLLVDALTGPRRSAGALRRTIERGERVTLSALVLYEWRRARRLPEELAAQAALFPHDAVVAFAWREAARAAELYRTVRRARGREIDLAIAACALVHDAEFWTLNPSDFRDIPGLTIFTG